MVIKFSCSESRFLMMGVSQLTKLIGEAKASKDMLTLEATVITGFELQAVEECKEKCKPVNVVRGKGRIFFNIKKDSYPSVFKLRAVDNVFIVNESFDTLKFTLNKEEDVKLIKDLVSKVDWAKSVPQWAELTGFKGVQFPKCAKKDPNEPSSENEPACQRCLALLKPTDILPSEDAVGALPKKIEPEANPIISVDDHGSSQLLADCDEKEVGTVSTAINRVELTAKNVESEDDISFHSAEDCVEGYNIKMVCSDSGAANTVIEASKCIPDSLSGGEIAEDVKELPIQSENVSKSPNRGITTEDQQSNGFEEQKLVEDKGTLALGDLCPKSDLPSVLSGITGGLKNTEQPGKAQDDPLNETKRGKKMSYWKKRREEQKEGKGKKKVPKPPPKRYIDDGIIKFRVTCHRSGRKHSFDSNDAAMHFGGQINDEFHWTVDLTRWDINVVLVIEDHSGYVTFGLTKESFHRRNISHFGPTTLRSTLCYSLIRYAEPRNGDIVIDPMCGGGSISIEGAKGFPKTFHICGDNNEKCLARTKENILFNTKTEPLNMDAFRWDVRSLPLKDQSVDVLVTDLPFGLRMGKWKENNALYDSVLRELARVVRSGSGRAALLTYDKAAMIKALRKNSDLWREVRSVMVNHGGIKCVVFLLLRKALLADEKLDKTEQFSGVKPKMEEMKDNEVLVADDAAGLHETACSNSKPEVVLKDNEAHVADDAAGLHETACSSPSLELLSTSKDPEQSVLIAPEETKAAKSRPSNPHGKFNGNRKPRKDQRKTAEEKSDEVPEQADPTGRTKEE